MTGIESKLGRFALIATVALIGLNLRPFITSIGPLAAGIQDSTALSLQGMARKMPDRRPWLWLWLTLAMQAAGFAGLAFMPGLASFVLAAVLGAGLGGCFALSLIVALDHLPDPAQAGVLSALMQGGGFILAAIPAWLVAALHDATGSYVAGWLWHLACVTVVAGLVVRFAPAGYARVMPELGGGLAFEAAGPSPRR
ncbi:hypothetical protein [Castellaniella sp.]|uniref:hypothetical protein n=1 Tax=Castellaniella sp. TaxID=1955812 RepID=UPI002AFFF53E|nr:hypothetical protein [Castellaniella sp.]